MADDLIEKVERLQIKDKKTKPLLKWVGGKSQILDTILSLYPIEINNYHEVFVGGGSVLLGFLTNVKNSLIKVKGKVYAYDINKSLICMYKHIQTNHEGLYFEIMKLVDIYKQCDGDDIDRNPETIDDAKKSKENYYYWIRKEFNDSDKSTLTSCAMFVFLNKTCFRGLYRCGPNGFNVPYGHYVNPEIVNKAHLIQIHNLISNVIFECCDFSVTFTKIKKNDFLYLDPPYAPETKQSFVGYNKDGFNDEQHKKLFDLCHNIPDCKIMMSNSDVDLVNEKFSSKKYNIRKESCKRSINSKKPNSKAEEVIIRNYT